MRREIKTAVMKKLNEIQENSKGNSVSSEIKLIILLSQLTPGVSRTGIKFMGPE